MIYYEYEPKSLVCSSCMTMEILDPLALYFTALLEP